MAIACRPGALRWRSKRSPISTPEYSLSCSKNESAESRANSGPLVLTSGTVYRLRVPRSAHAAFRK